MRVAYLACQTTLPGAPNRRVDAFEHDETMAALRAAFAAAGDAIEDVAWDDPSADWASFDAAVIGTTWDYWDRREEFLATLRAMEEATRVFNPPRLVAWNTDKAYLGELEARGVAIPPTAFEARLDEGRVAALFERFGCDELVAKRRIGAGAAGQHRLRRGAPVPAMPEPMLVQPFLEAIVTDGELSLVFVDGAFSHALRKRAAPGDYRVQAAFGGREEVHAPTEVELAAAGRVLAALGEVPLYARVDLVRGAGGAPWLMELEIVEPYLYPVQGPRLGELLHAAVRRRLEER